MAKPEPKPADRRDEKICERCNRPFQWRKKWAKDWPNVKYCSERCRRTR